MKCYVKPSEREKDTLFVSYCHADAARVFPIIERLAIEGFHVWYDTGVHPGEEWPETIARHMIDAKVCVAMISEAAAESHHCRNELTFAVSNSMPLLSILLEDFKMPLGMQLQLSNARYIRKYEETDEAFYAELLGSPVLTPFRSTGSGADEEALALWSRHAEEYSAAADSSAQELEPSLAAFAAASPAADEEDDDEQTILFVESPAGGDAHTVMGIQYNPALLLRVRTGEIFHLKSERTVLGRSKAKADIAFPDNPEISGKHAEIWERGSSFLLRNYNPTNATVVNGQVLQANASAELRPCSEILLADEQLFLLFGEAYENVFDEQKLCLLKSRDTGETRVLAEDSLPLDRRHKWRGDVLGDQRIHRSGHAEIYRENGRICVRDLGSRHGTFLNGRQLEPNVGVELHDNDIITVVETEFLYYEISTGA